MSDKQEIVVLDEISHTLLRPGMYIGSTKPEKQMFWVPTVSPDKTVMNKKEIEYIPGEYKIFCEVLDNAVDEHVRGFCDTIKVTYDAIDGYITVSDNGRGIPIDIHKDMKRPTPEVVFAQLRSGSNFSDDNRLTVGMNGVGAALATIFSEKLVIEIRRDNKLYQQVFSNNLSKIGKPEISKEKSKETGTSVKFKPDPKIFAIPVPQDLVVKRCLETSYMYSKLTVKLDIITDYETKSFEFKGKQFEELVKMFADEYQVFEDKDIKFAICLNKHTENFEQFSNVNGADTWRSGTHIDWVKETFSSSLKDKIKDEYKLEIANADAAKSMMLVLFMNWNAPQFEGQTKEKFVNDKKDVDAVFSKLFSSRRVNMMVNEMKALKETIYETVNDKLERKSLQDLRKKQKSLDRKRIAKLIECSSKNRSECSLYITEGDSAISNLATVRSARTMAGLPLRGKVMNVHEVSASDAIENKELQSIIGAIGLKIGESAVEFDDNGKMKKTDLNYGKIIIATDQDMDGYSIRCLLVNFFFKFWPDLFQAGLVYILETPLYECIDKKTNTPEYFYNKEDFENWCKGKNTSKYDISYFKGLGSCGKEAWNYMINQNPNLVSISYQNAKDAKHKLLMAFGKDSDARKTWLS